MSIAETKGGIEYDPRLLDRVEQRFWRGIECRRFGPVQATLVGDLSNVGMLNLVLGATAEGALADGQLAAAVEWVISTGIAPYVPVTPSLPESQSAADWLAGNGFNPAYSWMKFVRDAHPPRFAAPSTFEDVIKSGVSSRASMGGKSA